MKEIAEVKKHVASIHIKNSISFLERKLANVLLFNAYPELLTKEIHTMDVRYLCELAGFDSNNIQALKDAIQKLVETSVEWNLLNDKGKKKWGVASLLAQGTIEDGVCQYAYAPDMRQHLFHPEVYARINLDIQRKFNSKYALALYENCLRFKGVETTGWLSLALLRQLFGINEGEYGEFKILNNRVIKPAIDEVNKTSDIHIQAESKREKRSVVALKFNIHDNPQFATLPPPVDPVPPVPTDPSNILQQRLCGYGLTNSQAQKMITLYAQDYIQQNLDIVEKDYQAGKIENLPAYTHSAMKEDYRPRLTSAQSTTIKRKASHKTKAEELDKVRMQQELEDRENRRQRLQQALDGLTEQEKDSLQKRFLEHHRSNPLLKRWLKQGFEHRVVQSLFRAFAAEQLLA